MLQSSTPCYVIYWPGMIIDDCPTSSVLMTFLVGTCRCIHSPFIVHTGSMHEDFRSLLNTSCILKPGSQFTLLVLQIGIQGDNITAAVQVAAVVSVFGWIDAKNEDLAAFAASQMWY
jgi:hypothetical protein